MNALPAPKLRHVYRLDAELDGPVDLGDTPQGHRRIVALSPPVGRIDHTAAQELAYEPVALGRELGPLFATYWLRVAATVPESWTGARVDLVLDTRSEATLWLDGRAVQGLNSSGTQPRPDATLVPSAEGGERLAFELEIACNDPFGAGVSGEGAGGPYRTRSPFVLDACELARFDPLAWRLLHDFAVLRAVEAGDGVDPSFAGELLAQLDAFCNAWAGGDRSTWEPAGALLTAPVDPDQVDHVTRIVPVQHVGQCGGRIHLGTVDTQQHVAVEQTGLLRRTTAEYFA